MLTLTRTSWRALPRGLTQTVIGNPVVRGNRFAISKRSSGSSASAPCEPICFDFTTLLPLSLTVCIPIGAKHVPGQNVRVDIMAEHGLYSDDKIGKFRCRDPHLRLKDMETDGVDAEVIYGILGTASKLNDRDASNEVLRIYNDWLKEFCSHYPDRHIGLACLPYGSVDEAVKEGRRASKIGLRGLGLSCSWDMEPMWHPIWEPLWKAVADVDLPLHFHTFPTTAPRSRTEVRQVQRAAMFTGVSAFQMGLIHIMAGMMGAGV